MKKIFIPLLVFILAIFTAVGAISPVMAQDEPLPPTSPDESWQPPYEEGRLIEPPVNVETYGQTWSNLRVAPPTAVGPGIPSSIASAYLVNGYGQVVTNLYRNEACYLIVSFDGPGYFYLWEYYPPGAAPYGHWLSYRWYRPSAGVWKIGPFVAEPLDPAGRYIWRMWFLSASSWSTRTLSFSYTRGYYPPDIPRQIPGPIYPPVINSFSASKSSILAGETVVLTWTTTNASSVTVSPGVGAVAVSGSTTVTPTATTTYSLVASGGSGKTVTSTATVTVTPRVLPTITAGADRIRRSQSISISWIAPGATQVSITNIGNVTTTGTVQVSPPETATYTLTATYIDGTVQTAVVTVYVEQPPYLLWGIIALLAVIVIVTVVLLTRRRGQKPPITTTADTQPGRTTAADSTLAADTAPVTTPVVEARAAKLTMPDGNEILLAGNARSFGRNDFDKFLPPDSAQYISRQHITLWYEDGQYYIEDRSSTNGTKINGADIKGTGRHELADGDIIELAGKLNITFRI